jgi:hypothetical protein
MAEIRKQRARSARKKSSQPETVDYYHDEEVLTEIEAMNESKSTTRIEMPS